MPLAPATRLGPYEIVALLGSGGMGEVYRARDPRLGREIAIKVLPAALAASPDRLARFEREARTVAGLNHPNIVTLHSIEAAGDTRFLTMELVEGQSLATLVTPGGLPIRRVLDIATSLTEALVAAHEKNLVHRDLKPANVMLGSDGRVKVLDFGLAKLTQNEPDVETTHAATEVASISQSGQVLGTLPYMAPEQLRGETVDARTDLFSLGVLTYELVSGRRPFAGRTFVDLSSAILRDLPPSLRSLRAEVPAELERVILRCLRKDPGERYPTALDVLNDLRDLRRTLEARDPASPKAVSQEAPAIAGLPVRPSVAVLPFRDLQRRPENADLGLGLADATITELTLMRSLIVRPTSTILRYQDRGADPQSAANELSVDAVVDGSFQRSGERLRVTVQMISSADGRTLWATKIDTSLEDIFRMQDEVSRRIAAALDVELTPAEDRRLMEAARAAPAGDAYTFYMGGKRHLYRGTLADVNAAIECFDRARENDPTFALAWAGLGDAYGRMAFEHAPEGEWYTRAQAMCDKALALDPGLPEGRYLRGRLSWNPLAGFDHAHALREAAGALAAHPGMTEARYLLGLVLFHVGLLEESHRQFEQALAADPQDLYARVHVGTVRLHQGRFEEALESADEAVRAVPAPWSLCVLAHCQLRLSRLDDAERTVDRLSRESPDYSEVHALSGLVAALRGDAARARQGIERTMHNPRGFGHYHHAQVDVACIYATLGDRDLAVDWLGRAAHNGYPCRPYFAIDPLLQPLHGHEGFVRLMEDLHVECEGYGRLYAELFEAGDADPTTTRSILR